MGVLNGIGPGLHEKPGEHALVVEPSVVVDTKVIDAITDLERGQLANDRRITKLKVGLILNFRRPRLEWERLIL